MMHLNSTPSSEYELTLENVTTRFLRWLLCLPGSCGENPLIERCLPYLVSFHRAAGYAGGHQGCRHLRTATNGLEG